MLRLVLREIAHRKLNFILSLSAVALAAGCLLAALVFLREHDLSTAALLREKAEETRRELAVYEDEVRRLTLKLGFNILILPKDIQLADFHAHDFADRYMPEEYAQRLADSRLATVNHILPCLQQKTEWPEKKRTILVMGVRGEVYLRSDKQKPLLAPVRPGELALGYELHRDLEIKPGGQVRLLGREFKVAECKPAKGSKDDITVWLNLREAQELLGKPGLINAIFALECNCATVDRLGEVRAEVAKVLPDTQVIEYQTQALARAEARNLAAAKARKMLEDQRAAREELARRKEALAAVLLPLILAACAVWIGFAAWSNVRERRMEIGILRALGLRLGQVLSLVLGRAALAGLGGAGLGLAAGLGFARGWDAGECMRSAVAEYLHPLWLFIFLAAAVGLAAVGSWLPALLAARQDPADVLREG
jgi:hypothetical protein